MDEPSAVDRATPLSNLVKTAPLLVADWPPLLGHTPQKMIFHLPRQDARQKRGTDAETAATSADLRRVMAAIAARAHGLIEGCRRVRMLASSPVLIVAGKFGSQRGKLP